MGTNTASRSGRDSGSALAAPAGGLREARLGGCLARRVSARAPGHVTGDDTLLPRTAPLLAPLGTDQLHSGDSRALPLSFFSLGSIMQPQRTHSSR
ncbi:hypothetical protein MRX96_003903 [Rhipicephalus microplus]